jgi:hypothetical protein
MLFVARAVAKTAVVMTAPKRGPRASIIVLSFFVSKLCVIFDSFYCVW